MNRPPHPAMLKTVMPLGLCLALLVSVLAFPTLAGAKCPDVPSDLVCPELRYAFRPEYLDPGAEVRVVAHWIEIRTGQPVANAEWLARQGQPAYLWLWDHAPSELERIAYVIDVEDKAPLPQAVVPLQWDADKQIYAGTFVFPRTGRWYFSLGTMVPAALSATLAADGNYVGAIAPVNIPGPAAPVLDPMHWAIGLGLIVGGGLVIMGWLWRRRRGEQVGG